MKKQLAAAGVVVTLVLGFQMSPASAATPTLYTGTLTEHGAPVSGRVAVYVNDALLASVDTDGDVAVPLAYTANLRRLASSNDGYVNFDMRAASSRWFEAFSFSARFIDGAWVSEQSPRLELTTGRDDPAKAQMFLAPGTPPGCVSVKVGSPENRYTTIGEIHTPGTGSSATLTYGKTADSDIGVGVDTGGNWHLSGSVHVGDTNAASVSWTRGANYGKRESSLFAYQMYHVIYAPCDYYKIVAETWGGGGADGGDNSYLDGHCDDAYDQYAVKYFGGTDFDRSTSNYINFSLAANPFNLISVTNQSGMGTFVQVHYHFDQPQSQFRVICGTNAFPTYSLRILAKCSGVCNLSPEAREVKP